MSTHRNTTRSTTGEDMATTITALPIRTWNPDPMGSNRQTDWPVGQYDPFSSRPSQRRAPAGFDLSQDMLSMETRAADRYPVVTRDDLLPQTSPLQPQRGFSQGDPTFDIIRDSGFRPETDEFSASGTTQSLDSFGFYNESPTTPNYAEHDLEAGSRRSGDTSRGDNRQSGRRRPYVPEDYDGPSQLLPLPLPQQETSRSQALPPQPTNLRTEEQDEITRRVGDILAHCAFHFVAKYQFPIPLERDKPRVRSPADREWTEWAYILKRLATKRRIPARVLYDNQIRQFVTTLENSITMRYTTGNTRGDQPNTGRPARDDRYVLQLISSGIQVAKILMDSLAMEQLDNLYTRTEAVILERKNRARPGSFGF